MRETLQEIYALTNKAEAEKQFKKTGYAVCAR